jgi:hypothetical protein
MMALQPLPPNTSSSAPNDYEEDIDRQASMIWRGHDDHRQPSAATPPGCAPAAGNPTARTIAIVSTISTAAPEGRAHKERVVHMAYSR